MLEPSELANEGEPPRYEGFAEFVRHSEPGATRLAAALCPTFETAKDLVQDAYLDALVQWPRVRSLDEPVAWLRRVVLNKSRSHLRRFYSERRALSRLDPRGTPCSERWIEPWAAVRALPRRQAQVIALVAIEDMSVADIASVLGCSEPTVRTHLRRARHRLLNDPRIEAWIGG